MNTATLERATITVARIIPAKDRGKSATIKDIDGVMFGIWPDKLGLVNEGSSYDVDYSETVKNGTTYRDIKAVREVQRQAPRSQAAERKSDPFITGAEVREQMRNQDFRSPQEPPRQPPNGNGNYYRPTSPEDKKSMFRCACVTAFIRAGQLRADRNEIAAAVAEIDAGYDMAVSAEH